LQKLSATPDAAVSAKHFGDPLGPVGLHTTQLPMFGAFAYLDENGLAYLAREAQINAQP
tara:strand:- start:293 stop:469 length:177 start_codon:yes stop_codon:yes gene_type:complete